MGALYDQAAEIETLVRAFERVEDNRGGPGIDGETVESFRSGASTRLRLLHRELTNGTYRPRPLLRVYIPKRSGGKRPLSIPTVRDRVAQTAVFLVLGPILEEEFEDVSYAYRPGRSVQQAVQQVARLRKGGYRWVVDADIERYFDSVPHNKLLALFKEFVKDDEILDLVMKWVSAEIVDGDRQFRLRKGLPQGMPLSPLLANLYLDKFDETFIRGGYKLVRYADDFIILCRSRPHAERALELTDDVLTELGLALNRKKTRITDFAHGFRYLGQQFVGSFAFRPQYPEQEVDSSPMPASRVDGRENKEPEPAETLPASKTAVGRALRQALQDLPSGQKKQVWKRLRGESQPEIADEFPPPPAGNDPLLRTLYVMEQGARLSKGDERFVVSKEGKMIAEVPALKVNQVLIFGNVGVTTPAMQFCLLSDIPVFLLSSHGRYYGAIESTSTSDVLLHQAQFGKAADPGFCLNLSRGFVRGKLSNARKFLMRNARRLSRSDIREAGDALQGILRNTTQAHSLDELRGLEGAGAARFFRAYKELVPAEWGFARRRRRPPPDPVNSLLSYGYTLLFYNVYSLVRSMGLHPYVGFFHSLRQGHPALVSDLMEEFRSPLVDSVVLSLIRRRQVTLDDFEFPADSGRPCVIKDRARKVVTCELEKAMNRRFTHAETGLPSDYRRAIAGQVKKVKDMVLGRCDSYVPFTVR